MADILKIISTGAGILNQIQDNVQAASPSESAINEGILLEGVAYPSTSNHQLGRQAVGAIIVKQSGADFVAVTGLSATTITTQSTGSGTASIWVF